MKPMDLGFRLIHAYKIFPRYTVWVDPSGERKIIVGGPKKITFIKLGSIEHNLIPTKKDLDDMLKILTKALDDKESGLIIVPAHVTVEQYEV